MRSLLFGVSGSHFVARLTTHYNEHNKFKHNTAQLKLQFSIATITEVIGLYKWQKLICIIVSSQEERQRLQFKWAPLDKPFQILT